MTVVSKDTFYFIYFALCLNVVSAIAFLWVPESPRYLYGINELDKCSKVLHQIAKGNGIQDYTDPVWEVEYDIMIEVEGVDSSARLTSARGGENKSKNFDSLISQRNNGALKGSNIDNNNLAVSKGRYRTVANGENVPRDGSSASVNRLTKRETVALMHATVTGIRHSTNWWVIGVDRTQSFAIDEALSKQGRA